MRVADGDWSGAKCAGGRSIDITKDRGTAGVGVGGGESDAREFRTRGDSVVIGERGIEDSEGAVGIGGGETVDMVGGGSEGRGGIGAVAGGTEGHKTVAHGGEIKRGGESSVNVESALGIGGEERGGVLIE